MSEIPVPYIKASLLSFRGRGSKMVLSLILWACLADLCKWTVIPSGIEKPSLRYSW